MHKDIQLHYKRYQSSFIIITYQSQSSFTKLGTIRKHAGKCFELEEEKSEMNDTTEMK